MNRLLRFPVLRRQCISLARQSSASRRLQSTFSSLIGEEHRSIMNEEIELMKKLSNALRQIDAPKEDVLLIDDTRARIADFFTVVIVGEFNAGKVPNYNYKAFYIIHAYAREVYFHK